MFGKTYQKPTTACDDPLFVANDTSYNKKFKLI